MSDYRNMDWYDGPDAPEPSPEQEPQHRHEPPKRGRLVLGMACVAALSAVVVGVVVATHHDDHDKPSSTSSTSATATPGTAQSSTPNDASSASSSTSWPVTTVPASTPGNTKSAGGPSNSPKDEQQKKRDSDAKAEALTIMRLYAQPDADKDSWFNALKPHMDSGMAESQRYTDPGTISAHKVTGDAVVRPMQATDAREVAVPTDSGVWTLSMTYDTVAHHWVASAIAMPGDNGPGDH